MTWRALSVRPYYGGSSVAIGSRPKKTSSSSSKLDANGAEDFGGRNGAPDFSDFPELAALEAWPSNRSVSSLITASLRGSEVV